MALRVFSGGQTGVDRAALDAAAAAGLSTGGFCPRGRLAEDGTVPDRYPLQETPSPDYAQRTEWNVRDSDATLILARGALRGGTAFTLEVARRLGRPALVVDLSRRPQPDTVHAFCSAHGVRTLNVAGPRESVAPGIYAEARAFLEAVFSGAGPGGR
ncbi:MAG TPA: putative molybdenum carrier protein [Vicinamibacteria bacterium]|nr:putative molybdenum carrier protein [Vicinamibacteria bacterium]